MPAWLVVAVLAVLGGVLPLAIAARFGALSIPRNDAWSYVLATYRLADHGRLYGNGFVGKALVGQLFGSVPTVWIFGHSITALHVEVALIGVVGLLAVHDLARHFVPPRTALFVAAATAALPLWLCLSATFMTDVPMCSLALVSLALGARAVRADDLRVGWFIGSLAVGVVAVSVREYALVAPVAVCLGALWAATGWERRRRAAALIGLAGVIVATVVVMAWVRSLPGWAMNSPALPTTSDLTKGWHFTTRSGVLVGLLVLPGVVFAGPLRLVRSAWERSRVVSGAVGVVVAGALLVEIAQQRSSVYLLGPGNYVLTNGVGSTGTIHGVYRPDLFPHLLLRLAALVGVASTTVMVVALVPAVLGLGRRVRDHRFGPPVPPALAIVVLATLGFVVSPPASVPFGLSSFDRYFLPALPLITLLVVRAGRERASGPRPHRHDRAGAWSVAGWVVGAGLLVFGVVLAANSASFDAAKWEVADRAASVVGGVDRVDGGFEWSDWHAGRQVFIGPAGLPALDRCVILQVSPGPAGHGVAAKRVWTPRGSVWVVARRVGSC